MADEMKRNPKVFLMGNLILYIIKMKRKKINENLIILMPS